MRVLITASSCIRIKTQSLKSRNHYQFYSIRFIVLYPLKCSHNLPSLAGTVHTETNPPRDIPEQLAAYSAQALSNALLMLDVCGPNSLIVAVLTAIPTMKTALTHYQYRYLEEQGDCEWSRDHTINLTVRL